MEIRAKNDEPIDKGSIEGRTARKEAMREGEGGRRGKLITAEDPDL